MIRLSVILVIMSVLTSITAVDLYISLKCYFLIYYRTTEQDEMINKYNRVITSSLLAIRKLITTLPANQIEDLKEPLKTLLKDGKFWKHGKTTITSVYFKQNLIPIISFKSFLYFLLFCKYVERKK